MPVTVSTCTHTDRIAILLSSSFNFTNNTMYRYENFVEIISVSEIITIMKMLINFLISRIIKSHKMKK